MALSPLDNLVRIGTLKAEPPAQAEFDGWSVQAWYACVTPRMARSPSKADSTWPTTQRMHCHWRRCVGTVAVQKTAIWCSNAWNTPSALRIRNGAYSTRLTRNAISQNTKATWM